MRRTFPPDRLAGILDRAGLTSEERAERLRRYGPNDIVEVAENRWLELARETLKDPMIWFLVATGSLYGFLGETIEAVTMLLAIVPLVGMDAFLHRRTTASTEGLRSRLASWATVLQDGQPIQVAAREVVPGDLALLGPGEAFPADGLVVGGEELQADESTLTGEAFPVRKRPLGSIPMNGGEPSVEGRHWGFAGTRLLTGDAKLRVVFTGGETLYGEIVRSALRGSRARTPLQVSIARLVIVLTAASVVLCGILAMVRLHQGFGWGDALLSAVTLAAAAFPEEFPVVFSFSLGVGVYRLARQQALVRRAVSVENIGRVSTICSDKTGTITEGRLSLAHVAPEADLDRAAVLDIATAASRPDGGDPLDAAILAASDRAVSPLETLVRFPFTETRKRETAIVRDQTARVRAVTKGAAEIVLGLCGLDEARLGTWSLEVTRLAGEGYKVIACAWRPIEWTTWPGGEPDHGYSFAGLLAFADPVREGVVEAVASCRAAAIHVMLVTGDHASTARTVARQIGLAPEPVVISGEELEGRLREGLGPSLRSVDVVARAIPAQKLALVRALQAAGESVAVTGDGVNDVPALQAADVGIAMGERGTRSAREVAAIVLLDDNFRTIVRAIGEGRRLFHNLRLSFQYLLMIHIPLVISAALIPLAGYPLLYLPVHIVWLEMIIHPTAMLVFQSLPARRLLGDLRHSPSGRFFSGSEWLTTGLVGALVTGLVIASYFHGLGEDGNVERARGLALLSLTLSSATMTAALSGLRTSEARLVSAIVAAVSGTLIQAAPFSSLLHLHPLAIDDWGKAIAGSLAVGASLIAVSGRVRGGQFGPLVFRRRGLTREKHA